MDRVITVEYAIRDDDDRRNGHSPDRRGRDISPDARYGHRRSPSPYRRGRGSPDYGHGSNPTSRPEPRGSPKYERDESPINGRDDRFVLLKHLSNFWCNIHLNLSIPYCVDAAGRLHADIGLVLDGKLKRFV